MVEGVALYLQGKGHPIARARDAGLAKADDSDSAAYALARDLVVVTFDYDFRRLAFELGCSVLHVRAPENTARRRIALELGNILALLEHARPQLVTVLPKEGLTVSGRSSARRAPPSGRSRRQRRARAERSGKP